MTLDDIDALRKNKHNPIPVGELANIVRLELRLRVPVVQLSRETLIHINRKHPDVTDFDLLLLPFVIGHGLILREKIKRNVLLACYQEPMSHRRFVAVMKVASKECEVWLDSFYRTKPRQTVRLMRKSEKLKDHD